MTKRIRALLVAALLVGCSDPTGIIADGVELITNASGITIHNRRSADIFYFAVDAGTAATLLWVPCGDPNRCDGVEAGDSRRLDPDDVYGLAEAGEVIVYWWQLEPRPGGGFRPDSIRAMSTRVAR